MIDKTLGNPTLVFRKLTSITQILRLPSLCALCQQYHNQPSAICQSCYALLKPLGIHCQCCALPLIDEQEGLCGFCLREKPAFTAVYTAFLYEEPLRTLLHEFKYRQGLYLGHFLAELMLTSHFPLFTECLVPVPLHPKRLGARGFNQAAELCKRLAKLRQIPYDLTLCQKVVHTPPQAYLDLKQRKHNLQQVFRARPTSYRHITLVDDLVTSGNTVQELALTFKQQGVEIVDVWCCARALTIYNGANRLK